VQARSGSPGWSRPDAGIKTRLHSFLCFCVRVRVCVCVTVCAPPVHASGVRICLCACARGTRASAGRRRLRPSERTSAAAVRCREGLGCWHARDAPRAARAEGQALLEVGALQGARLGRAREALDARGLRPSDNDGTVVVRAAVDDEAPLQPLLQQRRRAAVVESSS
jgi:hypothetical protein